MITLVFLRCVNPVADKGRQDKTDGVQVRVTNLRVTNYCLDGVDDAERLDRLITTILDHEQAPAAELAALYHKR